MIRSQIAGEAERPLPGVLGRMDHAERPTAAALYERHLGDVFRYVLRRVGQREDAEDITAEVFAAAIQALPRFRGDCPPHLWLLGIARRQIAIALRRRAVRRETLVSEEDALALDALLERMTVEGPEAILARAEACTVLRELLSGLGADQREALLLQYGEGLSIAEIAVVMGRSQGSVNSLPHRARTTLYRRGQSYFLGKDEGTKR